VGRFFVQFQPMMSSLIEGMFERHQGLVALLFVSAVFTSLITDVMLACVSSLIPALLFRLLAVLQISRIITKARQVERFVLA
jgi:hypothetical protein